MIVIKFGQEHIHTALSLATISKKIHTSLFSK